MIRFKCNGDPYIDEQLFKEAINNWANTKGVNPDDVFAAINKDSTSNSSTFRCKPPLRLAVKGQINSSVFEEAVIMD